MKFLTIITFVLSVLFISCGKNDPTKNDNTPPPDFEKGPDLFTIERVLVGSSGSYSFAVNQFLSFEVWLDDNGNPKTEIHIPSHNREIAATAVISENWRSESVNIIPPTN